MLAAAAAAAKSLQSCLILCDPMDCSPPGSSIHGIFQARVLEWGAIAFSSLCLLPAKKKKKNLKYKLNDDIYRHTQAKRFHYQ